MLNMCPICNMCIPETSRGKGLHALSHGIQPIDFHAMLLGGRPTCACSESCKRLPCWKSWKYGFMKYASGHMSAEARKRGTKKLSKALQKNHWSRGKTKETHPSLARGGQKTSNTLREGFRSGRIKHWAMGETKETHPSIQSGSEKRSITNLGKKHWHWTSNEDLIRSINEIIGTTTIVTSGLNPTELACREKNSLHTLTLQCKHCQSKFNRSIYNIVRYKNESNFNPCDNCGRTYASKNEVEIGEFVESLGLAIRRNSRKNCDGHELDIWIPEIALAIEHNGLYWHSELINTDKKYHQTKLDAAKKCGITLMHVFEDEWNEKRDIIESMIRHRTNRTQTMIGARKCTILETPKHKAKEFFTANHIDGHVRGITTLGLFFDEELVCAMQLRKPFSSKWKGYIEIARFATKLNHSVPGGFTRLLNHAKSNFNSQIMTYVDTRFGSNGIHCKKSGMKLSHETDPSFWWTDKYKRYNRLYCKATPELTQKENAKILGLTRIWGCSNLMYTT